MLKCQGVHSRCTALIYYASYLKCEELIISTLVPCLTIILNLCGSKFMVDGGIHTYLLRALVTLTELVFLLDHAKEVKAMLSCSHGILLSHSLSSLSGYPKSLYKGMVVQWCPPADFDSNFHVDSNLKFLSQMPSRQNFHQKH